MGSDSDFAELFGREFPLLAGYCTGGSGSYTARLLVSTDGGGHWPTAGTDPQQLTQTGGPAWLGFENPQVGRWIGDPHGIWNTSDGGRHWTDLPFP